MQDEEDKVFTKQDLDLCISPYMRYDHDFGTHHMRLKKVEQWKRAESPGKKDLVPKSSRFPLDLKSLKSGMSYQQTPRDEQANANKINQDIASIHE